jgi:elongation factor Ts
MPVSIEAVKKFWQETGVSLSEAKKALDEANGDETKAKELLAAWGKKLADKKGDRETKSGVVEAYVHQTGMSGVLLDIRCETDFVANSPEFKKLAHEVALHIAAMSPETVEALIVQPWVKDAEKTITNLIEETVSKVGEKIEIKRFAHFAI